MIKAQLNIDVSKSTVWKYIRSNNLSFKRTKPYVGKANTQMLLYKVILIMLYL